MKSRLSGNSIFLLSNRYLFFMDVANIKKYLKIFVKKGPDQKLEDMIDVCRFYKETGSQLCHARKFSEESANLRDKNFRFGKTSASCALVIVIIVIFNIQKNYKKQRDFAFKKHVQTSECMKSQ